MASAATPAEHKHAKGASLEEQVKALQAQVDSLQQTVLAQSEAQRSAQAQTEAQLQASEQKAQAASAQAQQLQAKLDMQIQQIPGAVDQQVKSAVAAQPKPRTDAFAFKGITITPGGFLEAATIYRSKGLSSDLSSSYAKIPFENAPLSRTSEWRESERQSRGSFLAQGDITKTMHAAFYGEFDFLAAAQTANSNESNSFTPRVRNVYGTVDWDDYGLHFLAGQNWSLLTLNSKGISPRNEVTPPAIDAQYVPGFAWARQPQFRIVKDFADKQAWVGLSLENAQTTFTGTAGNGLPTGISVTDLVAGNGTINPAPAGSEAFSGFNTVNTMSLNRYPDVIGKIALEPDIGGARPLHIEAFGLWRSFYDQITVTAANTMGLAPGVRESSVDGYGYGGSVTWTVVPKVLDLQASIMGGKGIGRYGSAQLSDATLKPNGAIAPIHEIMYLAGGTWHATPKLDLYVFGGSEREQKEINAFNGVNFGFGDLTNASFTDAACKTVGGSCSATVREVNQVTAGLWDKAFTGPYGQIRIGLQYSHTWLEAFSGANGFKPTTSDDMVFTSFRYYPF
ncbi:FlxA-like family protein [Phenylobacterium sp.]|uniref:FlxA-like family protein n=1 Tax=Phenylobacterium sp. TaxID=1871053 RepID=UPI002F418DB0